MQISKEFTYEGKKFVGVRKLFGAGGYYAVEEGPEKLVKFKDQIFPHVDDVITHALAVMKSKDKS